MKLTKTQIGFIAFVVVAIIAAYVYRAEIKTFIQGENKAPDKKQDKPPKPPQLAPDNTVITNKKLVANIAAVKKGDSIKATFAGTSFFEVGFLDRVGDVINVYKKDEFIGNVIQVYDQYYKVVKPSGIVGYVAKLSAKKA